MRRAGDIATMFMNSRQRRSKMHFKKMKVVTGEEFYERAEGEKMIVDCSMNVIVNPRSLIFGVAIECIQKLVRPSSNLCWDFSTLGGEGSLLHRRWGNVPRIFDALSGLA